MAQYLQAICQSSVDCSVLRKDKDAEIDETEYLNKPHVSCVCGVGLLLHCCEEFVFEGLAKLR